MNDNVLPDFTPGKAPYFGHQAKVEHIESLFIETNTPYITDGNLFWNGKSFLCRIKGISVGFVIEVADTTEYMFELRRMGAEIVFQIHGPPEVFALGAVPFPAASFGYHDTTWCHYTSMVSDIYYTPNRDKGILCYLGYEEPYKPTRQAAADAVAKVAKVANVLYYDKSWWKTFMLQINSARIAVAAPGMNPFMLDKTVMQYLAFGIAFIHPRIGFPLPGPLVPDKHYIVCKDDYSDLESLIDHYTDEQLTQIGHNARNYFRRYLMPHPLMSYIHSAIESGTRDHDTGYISPATLVLTDNLMRNQRRVQRYRLARRYAYGEVVDYGCGSGYGTQILSVSDRVKGIQAYDSDEFLNSYARTNYGVQSTEGSFECDTLIMLEVVEHLGLMSELERIVTRFSPKRIIVSYPNYESTWLVKSHKRNITNLQIPGYCPFLTQLIQDEETVFKVFDRQND